jgi:hypothetical protein
MASNEEVLLIPVQSAGYDAHAPPRLCLLAPKEYLCKSNTCCLPTNALPMHFDARELVAGVAALFAQLGRSLLA